MPTARTNHASARYRHRAKIHGQCPTGSGLRRLVLIHLSFDMAKGTGTGTAGCINSINININSINIDTSRYRERST